MGKKELGFSFSERHLRITTDDALSITVAGIRTPIKITEISYHEQTGKFNVKTDTPLGLAEGTLNDRIEAELNSRFKGKVQKAFKELKTVRSKRNLADVNKVMTSIMDIFKDGRQSEPFPNMSGDVELVFTPDHTEDILLDKLRARIQKDDRLSASIQFRRQNNSVSINSLEFFSTKGVNLAAVDRRNGGVASIDFRRLAFTTGGVDSNYQIGAENLILGVGLAVHVLQTLNNRAGNFDCDDAKLTEIRASLDSGLRAEIATLIRNNRAALVRGGFSPALLNALD